MSNQRRSHCQQCGASGNDVRISRTGLCPDCGQRRLLDNVQAMQTATGYQHDRWLRGMERAAAAASQAKQQLRVEP